MCLMKPILVLVPVLYLLRCLSHLHSVMIEADPHMNLIQQPLPNGLILVMIEADHLHYLKVTLAHL